MHGLMQDFPLRVTRLLDHAASQHPGRRVLGRSIEGPIVTSDWATIRARALRVAQRLGAMGLGRDDVVGSMAWNTTRHLEIWYGVPGAGAALHTINPRLSADQMVYVINHAEDRLLMVDADLLPLIEAIWPRLETVQGVIVLCDAAHLPKTTLPEVRAYEDWLAEADGDFAWVEGDERDACGICFTSGTTGAPKGVVYTHRSNVLHAMMVMGPDVMALSCRDTLMPVVPMFHANGWSTAFTAPLAGASMVLPGRDLSPAGLYEMLEQGVTITAAVPTIWLGLLAHLEANHLRFSTLNRVAIGGASCPRAVIDRFQDLYGVRVFHAWGMTETSPIGTYCALKPEVADLPKAELLHIQETVGTSPFTVETRIVAEDGSQLPRDGETQGRLEVRGAAVVRRYLKAETDAARPDGWFDTGDMAVIDPHGYVRITDRTKDIIKSGGEWISSIELENAAIAHPDVAEAAAVGMPHPRWGERPILVVVMREGAKPDPEGIRALLAEHFAKWQLPDDILFLETIPHTATGKISKLHLRRQLAEESYALAT